MSTTDQRTLVIEGNLVRLQRVVTEREVKTSDFVDEIAKLMPLHTGVLPRGCVMLSKVSKPGGHTKMIYVIERPAGIQPMKYQPVKDDESSFREIRLSWPNSLWFINCVDDVIHDVYLTATREPLIGQSKDTPLHRHLVPNIYDYGDGAMCLGNLVVTQRGCAALRIEALIAEVLDSLWNADLLPDFTNTGIESIEDWATKSAAEPEFHKKMKFPEHRCLTVGGMLNQLLGAGNE